jgi:hypothetical protein
MNESAFGQRPFAFSVLVVPCTTALQHVARGHMQPIDDFRAARQKVTNFKKYDVYFLDFPIFSQIKCKL